jgi:hypothetical protein
VEQDQGTAHYTILEAARHTKYLQVLFTPSTSLTSLSRITGNGLQILLSSTILPLGGPQFDGFADFLAPNFEALLQAFEELFYNERLITDEDYLIDPAATVIVNAE